MNVRNKSNWIKDILSKSGTEITAVNEDKPEGWLPTFFATQTIAFLFYFLYFLKLLFITSRKGKKLFKICKFINEIIA